MKISLHDKLMSNSISNLENANAERYESLFSVVEGAREAGDYIANLLTFGQEDDDDKVDTEPSNYSPAPSSASNVQDDPEPNPKRARIGTAPEQFETELDIMTQSTVERKSNFITLRKPVVPIPSTYAETIQVIESFNSPDKDIADIFVSWNIVPEFIVCPGVRTNSGEKCKNLVPLKGGKSRQGYIRLCNKYYCSRRNKQTLHFGLHSSPLDVVLKIAYGYHSGYDMQAISDFTNQSIETVETFQKMFFPRMFSDMERNRVWDIRYFRFANLLRMNDGNVVENGG